MKPRFRRSACWKNQDSSSHETRSLSRAKRLLQAALETIRSSSSSDQWLDYMLEVSIYLSLSGEVGMAEEKLREIQKHFPENDDAKEILKAIGR